MVVRSSGGMLEEVDDDLCGDFFDHIDDLLDFPVEDLDVDGAGDEQGEVGLLGAADPPPISAGSPPFSGSLSTEDDLAAGLAVPVSFHSHRYFSFSFKKFQSLAMVVVLLRV